MDACHARDVPQRHGRARPHVRGRHPRAIMHTFAAGSDL
jgi:hypothetical protein